MSRANWRVLYPVVGVLLGAILTSVDHQRGLLGVLAAWLICGVPIVIQWVASRIGVCKKTANRGLIAFPPGLLLRLVWTLGAASVAYYLYGDWLGAGFWIAVLVCYQTALVTRTRNQLDDYRP